MFKRVNKVTFEIQRNFSPDKLYKTLFQNKSDVSNFMKCVSTDHDAIVISGHTN